MFDYMGLLWNLVAWRAGSCSAKTESIRWSSTRTRRAQAAPSEKCNGTTAVRAGCNPAASRVGKFAGSMFLPQLDPIGRSRPYESCSCRRSFALQAGAGDEHHEGLQQPCTERAQIG